MYRNQLLISDDENSVLRLFLLGITKSVDVRILEKLFLETKWAKEFQR